MSGTYGASRRHCRAQSRSVERVLEVGLVAGEPFERHAAGKIAEHVIERAVLEQQHDDVVDLRSRARRRRRQLRRDALREVEEVVGVVRRFTSTSWASSGRSTRRGSPRCSGRRSSRRRRVRTAASRCARLRSTSPTSASAGSVQYVSYCTMKTALRCGTGVASTGTRAGAPPPASSWIMLGSLVSQSVCGGAFSICALSSARASAETARTRPPTCS